MANYPKDPKFRELMGPRKELTVTLAPTVLDVTRPRGRSRAWFFRNADLQ